MLLGEHKLRAKYTFYKKQTSPARYNGKKPTKHKKQTQH